MLSSSAEPNCNSISRLLAQPLCIKYATYNITNGMDLSSLLMIHSNSLWVKTCIRIRKPSHIVILYVYVALYVYTSKVQVKEKIYVYFSGFPNVSKIYILFLYFCFSRGKLNPEKCYLAAMLFDYFTLERLHKLIVWKSV